MNMLLPRDRAGFSEAVLEPAAGLADPPNVWIPPVDVVKEPGVRPNYAGSPVTQRVLHSEFGWMEAAPLAFAPEFPISMGLGGGQGGPG